MIEISVIMPAYNAGKYIEDSIKSVIGQTFTNWELIIIDDGSCDNTKEIVYKFIKSDSRIKYLYQDNGKQGKARNLGISVSRGGYIALLDADDIWCSNKLERQIDIMKLLNEVSIISTSGKVFMNSINEICNNWSTLKSGFYTSKQMLPLLLEGNKILNSSVLIRHEVLKKCEYFNTNYYIQNSEDYDLWLKIAENGFGFFILDEPLTYYRKHQWQSTNADGYASKQAMEVLACKDYTDSYLDYLKGNAVRKYFYITIKKSDYINKKDFWRMIYLLKKTEKYGFFEKLIAKIYFILPYRYFRSFIVRSKIK